MINWTYNARSGLGAKIERRITLWRAAAPAHIQCPTSLVTFCFDDFPKSAINGADIVEKHGGKAGFFACTSMAGVSDGPYGEMFDASTLSELSGRGHEIGAHTHSHMDCSTASSAHVLEDVSLNLEQLNQMGHDKAVTSFAFPFGETSFDAKSCVVERFSMCRGVMPGINKGRVDRAQLRAFELSPNPAQIQAAVEAVKRLNAQNEWLIFFTHDVSAKPTPYGVAIELLEQLVQIAKDVGAEIAPPSLAAEKAGILTE